MNINFNKINKLKSRDISVNRIKIGMENFKIEWTETVTTGEIGLIEKNLLKLAEFIFNKYKFKVGAVRLEKEGQIDLYGDNQLCKIILKNIKEIK